MSTAHTAASELASLLDGSAAGEFIPELVLAHVTDGSKAAWAEEVERRVAALDRGELPSYPAEDVFD